MLPTERFSSRVANYIAYRPGYPRTLVDLLAEHHGLTATKIVADIGSGTGLLTRLFLDAGCAVFGVEPNREMRAAGERLLSDFTRFSSVAGTAEATTLPEASVDLIVAGQAFHWFDREPARAEFSRILRPGGNVALIWNVRLRDATPFMAEYERLLAEFSTDYDVSHDMQFDGALVMSFFAPAACRVYTVRHRQIFDAAGLRGRLLSSSYVPDAGHPRHDAMLAALDGLFARYQSGGQVAFEYDATMYVGRLEA